MHQRVDRMYTVIYSPSNPIFLFNSSISSVIGIVPRSDIFYFDSSYVVSRRLCWNKLSFTFFPLQILFFVKSKTLWCLFGMVTTEHNILWSIMKLRQAWKN